MGAGNAGHGARDTGHGQSVRSVLRAVANGDFKRSRVLLCLCTVLRVPRPASEAPR
jgi:hypothetical protein